MAGPGGEPDGRLVRHDRRLHHRVAAYWFESLSRADYGGAFSADGSVGTGRRRDRGSIQPALDHDRR